MSPQPASPAPDRPHPLACRIGVHIWPATFLPGATPVHCVRCGSERDERWWRLWGGQDIRE